MTGKTIVVVLHDLNLACWYADHVVAMKEGRIIAEGLPWEVVRAETIETVFGLSCQVIEDPVTRSPLVVPGGPTALSRAARPAR